MNARTLPITQVKPDLKDSLRMAVADIERFLAMFYPINVIRQQQAAQAIAGQWLSRVQGFHDDEDFLYLVRDFLAYVLSGGARSLASDQLDMFFSGFMPSYGAARTFLGIVNDGGTWPDVRAYMHSQAYGNAREYVESFDWSGGGQKAQAEARGWLDVLREEDNKLKAAGQLIAFVAPGGSPWLNTPPVTDVPAPVLPAAEGAAERTLTKLLTRTAFNPWLIGIVLLTYSPGLNDGEDAAMAKIREQQRAYARQKKLAIPDPQVKTTVVVDTTNNTECKAQIEKNQQNGAKCENDGYTLMEAELFYSRLVNPPKGRGLDGLFEKKHPLDYPTPMPADVVVPKPGKLVFIPPDKRPPLAMYNSVSIKNSSPNAVRTEAVYPKYVVFEAKNIDRSFDPTQTEEMTKEARRRLKNTCDGLQLSEPWTAIRIPQALKREDSLVPLANVPDKILDIDASRYARWLFACLPGPPGTSSKLYIFIDIVAKGLDLESTSPKPRKAGAGSDGSGIAGID